MNFLEYASKHKKLLGLLLVAGLGLIVCAGGQDSWKEEVLLHDGSTLIVERSQRYGGRHEFGQSAPISEQEISFSVPGATHRLSFKSEYSDDVGRANFNLLALHILKGTPYLLVAPNLCLAYNKWGRPNPPYVIFRHDGKSWQRIPLQELPSEFEDINLVVSTKKYANEFSSLPIVSVELVKKLNSSLKQPEYNSILRVPLPEARIKEMCGDMVLYKGVWIMRNDSVMQRMIDDRQKQNFSTIQSGDK